MYKIYNNEIKILQFLNGGAFFESSHPMEAKVYNTVNIAQNNGSFGFLLNLMDDDLNFYNLRPLFAQEVVFENLNQKMFMAIILTLSMFNQYATFLQTNAVLDATNPVNLAFPNGNIPSGSITNLEQAKKIRKKLYILAISVLKALKLYDHNNNDFVDYGDWYQKNIGNGSRGDEAITIPNAFKDGVSAADLAKKLEPYLKENPNNINIPDITLTTGTMDTAKDNLKAILTDIYKPNSSFAGPGTAKIPTGYGLFNFYTKIKDLYKDVGLTPVECNQIYYKQIFLRPVNSDIVNPRYPVSQYGGSYDKLEYMLNGGSINSIVRIPNLTSYFKTQLKMIEHRLKVNNKTLSEKSKGDIMQIIDALDNHEKKLKEQFDLLKNAHLIDSEVVSTDLDKSKLEKAKKHLNKHVRYSGALGDIIRTIVKEFKNEAIIPAFERL